MEIPSSWSADWADTPVLSRTNAPVNVWVEPPVQSDVFYDVVNIPVSPRPTALSNFVDALAPGKTVYGIPSGVVVLGLFAGLVVLAGKKRR